MTITQKGERRTNGRYECNGHRKINRVAQKSRTHRCRNRGVLGVHHEEVARNTERAANKSRPNCTNRITWKLNEIKELNVNEAEDGPKPVQIQRGAHNLQIRPDLSDR